jgi:hypothetical protein
MMAEGWSCKASPKRSPSSVPRGSPSAVSFRSLPRFPGLHHGSLCAKYGSAGTNRLEKPAPTFRTPLKTHILDIRLLPMRCPRRKVGLPEQFSLFADRSSGPERLRYAGEFVSRTAEKTLIGHIAALPLQPFQFGQYEGKRRVASFGFRYDYTMRRSRRPIRSPRLGPDHREGRSFRRPRHPNWPCPLHGVRRRRGHRLAPRQAALRPGVWPVAGLRVQVPVSKARPHQVGAFYSRGPAAFDLHMSGPSRDAWEHTIPAVEAQRYSITFRTMVAKSRWRALSSVIFYRGGRVPPWLATRMSSLGAIIPGDRPLGRDEFLQRLSHPFWFQSFGAVMGWMAFVRHNQSSAP